VDLNVTYRVLKAAATISGTYFAGDPAGTSLTGSTAYGPASIALRFAGLSVGIDASFEM
jgi:hypothetical protein